MVQYIAFLGDNYCKVFTAAGNPCLPIGKKKKKRKEGEGSVCFTHTVKYPKQHVKIKMFQDHLISVEDFEHTNCSFFASVVPCLAYLIQAKASETFFLQLDQNNGNFQVCGAICLHKCLNNILSLRTTGNRS